ncbi:hypothetical protein BRC75_00455 [Halobacteriales archaeon QH_7_69_31]|nr:MAG: hypothetical protein BRC75_00455 [Halobacteriales archaeon QH_7_69_31]
MNLEELQSVQARERQSSDLQDLRSSFYREVGEFIRELTAERDEAVEAATDPFSAPEVRRLSDDIRTARRTAEAIYERRVGKVMKQASIAAAGMPVDDGGLTDEEADLFEDLVDHIERNRERVLGPLEADAAVEPSTAAPEDTEADGPEAADALGAADIVDDADPAGSATATGSSEPEDPAGSAPETPEPPETEPPGREPSDTEPTGREQPGPDQSESNRPDRDPADQEPDDHEPAAQKGGDPEQTGDDGAAAGGGDVPAIPRTTVRITADVGEVVGADDRDYDLSPADVVTLPAPNAEVLLDNDAAERLE